MNGLYTIYENDVNGRKTPKEKVKIEQNKHHLVSLPCPTYNMEADCFLVSKGTENKPGLL